MDEAYLAAIVEDLGRRLPGAKAGRVWQPSATDIVLDLRLADGRLLRISVSPSAPLLLLTRHRPAESARAASRPFAATIRKHVGSARVVGIQKLAEERVVHIAFERFDDAGRRVTLTLVAELTGRSADVLLLDANDVVVAGLRSSRSFTRNRQGSVYQPPPPRPPRRPTSAALTAAEREDPSAALEARLERADRGAEASRRRMFLSRRIRAALARDRRLLAVLEAELAAAEGCEGWRQLAESLLAQVASARAVDGGLLFTDYYADPPAQTRIECDRGETAQQVAERLFRRYRKARRRIEAASQRVPNLAQRIAGLEELEKRVEASGDDALDNLEAEAVRLIGIAPARRQDPAAVEAAPAGMRRFVTSDGFEVLVGRTAAANDRLTFRIAKASDLWLHAADYPGSHVIVRNPSRQQIPERTIREAASIAAFYSQAGRDALVDVRCCERRYVTKPKRAATGLVRLSRFRTIAVRPARGRDETPDEEER